MLTLEFCDLCGFELLIKAEFPKNLFPPSGEFDSVNFDAPFIGSTEVLSHTIKVRKETETTKCNKLNNSGLKPSYGSFEGIVCVLDESLKDKIHAGKALESDYKWLKSPL